MGALDGVLSEAESRFGLSSSKASSLLSGLLNLVQEQTGGLSGFLDRFRRAGLGDSVSSWLSGGSKPINAENVETVLGRDTVNNLAARSGVSASTTASALAFYLPRVIQRMAPGGVVPSTLPADFAPYIGGATGPTGAMASGAYQTVNYPTRRTAVRRGVSGVLWPLWVIIAIVIIAIAFWWGAWGNRGNRVARRSTVATDAVQQANRQASAALAALHPGYSSQELVRALNAGRIIFPEGTAQIPPDDNQLLNQSAEAIKGAPAGSVIEIAGFARNTGNGGDNGANANANSSNNESALQLSQDRANAVREYFINRGVNGSMLVAKGYGDMNPANLTASETGGAGNSGNAPAENNPSSPGANESGANQNQNNTANAPESDIAYIARH